jgi:hypothetical protein
LVTEFAGLKEVQSKLTDPIIAYTTFLDGSKRPVFEQLDGRQYVLDDDAERVYGIWFIPPEETVLLIIVHAKCPDDH